MRREDGSVFSSSDRKSIYIAPSPFTRIRQIVHTFVPDLSLNGLRVVDDVQGIIASILTSLQHAYMASELYIPVSVLWAY